MTVASLRHSYTLEVSDDPEVDPRGGPAGDSSLALSGEDPLALRAAVAAIGLARKSSRGRAAGLALPFAPAADLEESPRKRWVGPIKRREQSPVASPVAPASGEQPAPASRRSPVAPSRRGVDAISFAVVRHAERADVSFDPSSVEACDPAFPYDGGLSASGHGQAEALGAKLAALGTFHRVVSSPYLRCVDTAIPICRALQCPLIIDLAWGEVCNHHTFGEQGPPPAPTRSLAVLRERCARAGVAVLNDRFLGTPPAFPERHEHAKARFCEMFLTYLDRGRLTRQGVVVVTHGSAVPACLALMPQEEGTPCPTDCVVPFAAYFGGTMKVDIGSEDMTALCSAETNSISPKVATLTHHNLGAPGCTLLGVSGSWSPSRRKNAVPEWLLRFKWRDHRAEPDPSLLCTLMCSDAQGLPLPRLPPLGSFGPATDGSVAHASRAPAGGSPPHRRKDPLCLPSASAPGRLTRSTELEDFDALTPTSRASDELRTPRRGSSPDSAAFGTPSSLASRRITERFLTPRTPKGTPEHSGSLLRSPRRVRKMRGLSDVSTSAPSDASPQDEFGSLEATLAEPWSPDSVRRFDAWSERGLCSPLRCVSVDAESPQRAGRSLEKPHIPSEDELVKLMVGDLSQLNVSDETLLFGAAPASEKEESLWRRAALEPVPASEKEESLFGAALEPGSPACEKEDTLFGAVTASEKGEALWRLAALEPGPHDPACGAHPAADGSDGSDSEMDESSSGSGNTGLEASTPHRHLSR